MDFKKVFRALYAPPSREVVRVEVPPLRYLMVDGSGDPNSSPAYQQAVGCLYAVSYTLRFSIKRGPQAVAYGVMPLEGLWWADDMRTFSVERKSEWKWTLMIMQPDPVEASDVSEAIEQVRRKKQLVAVERLRFETFEEGVCAQTLHLGPFSEEGPTIERVHAFIAERGSLRGKHHEMYLSDIR